MKSTSRRVLLSLLILSTPCVTAAQSITTVVSAADYGAAIAPGSIASVFGANLANTHAAATLDALGNLPTSLNGTSVSVNGELAGLFYVSPGQVNFLVPKDIPIGNVIISVASPAISAPATANAQIQLSAPGVFTIACLRTDRGAVENGVTAELEPFQATTQQNPGNDKRTRLSIYGTGFRYANNPARDDSAPVTSHVVAQIIDSNHNAFAAPVEYAGPQRILSGLDQINIVLPPEADGLGVATLQLTADGVAARPVTIALSPKSVAASQPRALSLSTVAGSGAFGPGGDNSSALLAQLRNPSAMAFDAGHNLYIADSDNHVIRMVNSAGTISTFAGTGVSGFSGDNGPASTAQLRRPVSLAFDSLGNLYVADAADNRVRKISPAGAINTIAGTGEAGFFGDDGPAISAGLNAPGGIAVNTQGTIFIADTANNRVRRLTADGLISTIAGTGTVASGSQTSAYLTPLSGPTDVSVDPSGNVLVADSENFVIRRIGIDGTISTIAGAGISGSAGTNCPALQALFSAPIHLSAAPSGQLIVSDSQQIRIIDANCNIYDAAGAGAAGFSGDGGNALQGAFNTPLGLALDQTGNIYVADSANQRIRKLSVSPSAASLSFHPAAVKTGQTVNGYIDLGSSRSTPSVVQLSSSPSLAELPGAVTIPAGQTTGVVTFTAPEVDTQTPVTVTASGPGLIVSGMLTEAPGSGSTGSGDGSTPALASLTLGSDNISVGDTTTGTIALTQPAPAGGLPVTLTSNNPAAKVVRSFVIPAGQTSAQFLIASGAASAPATATITAQAGGSGLSAALNIASGVNGTTTNPQSGMLGTLAQVSVNPSPVTAGQSATGTVTLASPAGPNGVSATIASSDPSITVPSIVTVTPGALTATFPIDTTPVNTAVTANITATSANSLTAPITVNPAAAINGPGTGTVAGVSINPSTITGGQPATGTVTLASPAGPGGVLVGLSSNVPGVAIPSSVTVPQGSTTATFPVTTSPVTAPASGSITATSANATGAPVTVTPSSNSNSPGTGTIAGVSINPSTITGGQPATGTVTLASPAGPGGVSVGLSNSVPGVTVPASVTVPQGSASATFPVTTSPVTTAASGSITASSANSLNASVTVTPSSNSNTPGTGTIAGVSISPSTITGGQPATGTVTLASPAGPGGVSIGLSSSVPGVSVPPSVTVPQGSTTATFPVTTSPVTAPTSGSITATSANAISAPVTVTPSSNANTPGTGTIAGISISPSTITGGQPATGTVTLASPAGPAGVSVGLSSSVPGVTVPASVTVPQGSTNATFPVTTSPVSAAASGSITANSANSLSAPVTVTPAAVNSVTPASVTFSPNSVTGGQSVMGTVSMSGAAPAGGTAVQLTSSSGSVAVPGSVSVAAGQTSATFTASTTPVASTTSATITASAGGASASGAVTVNPPCPSFVSASLGTPTLSGGIPLTVNTTLNGAAPSGGVNVGLTSQGRSLGNVTIPAGQTSGSTNLTLANALGLVGGGIDALSGSCPLIHGAIN